MQPWTARQAYDPTPAAGPRIVRVTTAVLAGCLLTAACLNAAVLTRVYELPRARQMVSPQAAFSLFCIEIEATEGERWETLDVTLIGKKMRPDHLRPPSPSAVDKHRRLEDRSGIALYRMTHDDGTFFANNAHPSWNDAPVTLDSAAAVDLSAWPRIRLTLPGNLGELPPPHRFVLALNLSKDAPPPHGLTFRARLDRLGFSRNTPWFEPVMSRLLQVDTQPPSIHLSLQPRPPVAPGTIIRVTAAANEPLQAQPQLLFHPKGDKLNTDQRGRPMSPQGETWTLTVSPLTRLTPNGVQNDSPVRYTVSPPPIPEYPDDGTKLLDAECRPSWFVGKAVQWRLTPRVDIVVDLNQTRTVHAAQIWLPYREEVPLVDIATAANADGPWTAQGRTAPPHLGRGPQFSQPLNQAWLSIDPRPARYVRYRLHEHPGPQVTEVVLYGAPERVKTGPWQLSVRAWDRALNPVSHTIDVEIQP